MKKLIILTLSIIALITSISCGTNVTSSYDAELEFNFYNNTLYDFETGVWVDDTSELSWMTNINNYYTNYASTDRRNFNAETLTLNQNVHYVFFWTAKNEYLGYYKVTGVGVHENGEYLGETDLTVDVPTNAKKIALMVNKNGEDSLVDSAFAFSTWDSGENYDIEMTDSGENFYNVLDGSLDLYTDFTNNIFDITDDIAIESGVTFTRSDVGGGIRDGWGKLQLDGTATANIDFVIGGVYDTYDDSVNHRWLVYTDDTDLAFFDGGIIDKLQLQYYNGATWVDTELQPVTDIDGFNTAGYFYLDAGLDPENEYYLRLQIDSGANFNTGLFDPYILEFKLIEVYDYYTNLGDLQLITNGDFNTNNDGWLDTYTNRTITNELGSFKAVIDLAVSSNLVMRTNTPNPLIEHTANDKYYINFRFKGNKPLTFYLNNNLTATYSYTNINNWDNIKLLVTLTSASYTYLDIRVTDGSWSASDYYYVDDVYFINCTNDLINDKHYSSLYTDTFDNLTDNQIKLQMDDYIDNEIWHTWYDTVLIDYYQDVFTYNITSELAYWQDLYIDYYNDVLRYEWYMDRGATESGFDLQWAEYNRLTGSSGISLVTFDNTEVTYPSYTSTIADIDDTLDEEVEAFGLGDFGKFLIIGVIITLVSLALAFMGVPGMAILILDILIFTLGIVLGWIATWIGLLIGLILFGLLILNIFRR